MSETIQLIRENLEALASQVITVEEECRKAGLETSASYLRDCLTKLRNAATFAVEPKPPAAIVRDQAGRPVNTRFS